MENNETLKFEDRLLEKYRPKTLEEMKLPKRIMNILMEVQKTQGYRLLLFSTPGTGKTSTARLLTADQTKNEVLYLSGSNDFNIEVLRNKVMTFSSSFSIQGKQKTCIIDECDNLRNDIQDAFKIILDQCKKVNFIFITNEVEKVNSAVKSRCTNLEYDFNAEEKKEQEAHYVQFAVDICKKENIKFTPAGLKELYKINFPDFRHLLVTLQQAKDGDTEITVDNVKNISEIGNQNVELYEIIMDISLAPGVFYQKLTQFKGREKEALLSLGEPFFRYLNEKQMFDQTLKSALYVADYSNKFVVSLNKFTTFLACCIALKSIFK